MMKNIFRHWSLCLVLLLAGPVPAQQGISLSQSLDPQTVGLDEQAILEIELTWNGPQSAYRFNRPLQPDLDGLMMGRFETSISSKLVDSQEVSSKTFLFSLIPTEPGQARVAPITISYVTWPDSMPGELTTESVNLTVEQPEPPQTGGGSYGLLILGVLLVLAIGILVGVLTFLARKRRAADVPASPEDQMLADIDQLKQSAGSDLKKFQTGLHQYLVKYLTIRYELDLAGKSASEIDQQLQETSISEDDRRKLISWLERAEREKFAPVQGSPGETTRLATELRQYFEKKKSDKS